MLRKPDRILSKGLGSALLAAVLLLLPGARADEPVLAIRVIEGGDALYAVSEIERMGFVGEGALVVETASGPTTYEVGTISRIEFLWDFSTVRDPAEAAELLSALRLFQNQPNPFSSETLIRFELPRAGQAELSVYSPDGRQIRRLVSGERRAGRQTVRWDGLDDAGRKAPGGVYFYNLTAPGVAESRRMILLP